MELFVYSACSRLAASHSMALPSQVEPQTAAPQPCAGVAHLQDAVHAVVDVCVGDDVSAPPHSHQGALVQHIGQLSACKPASYFSFTALYSSAEDRLDVEPARHASGLWNAPHHWPVHGSGTMEMAVVIGVMGGGTA